MAKGLRVKKEKKPGKKLSKRAKKAMITLVVILVAVAGGLIAARNALQNMMKGDTHKAAYEVKEVERRTIENYLSSSGTLNALDTYSVSTISSVEGTVLTANFEEGDIVNEGDVLYQISTDDMASGITSAQKSIDRAQKNYDSALEEYNEASKDYEKLNLYAEEAGYVKSIEVEVGDTIQAGSNSGGSGLVHILNNRDMQITVPFLAAEVSDDMLGQTGWVEITENGEWIEGMVTDIEAMTEIITGNQIVRYVTIMVDNPGAIVAGTAGSGWINDINSCQAAAFEVAYDDVITAEISGEVKTIEVTEGQWVEAGTLLVTLTADTLEDQLESYQDKIDSAKESLEDAQDNYDDVMESMADYTVTSPITGTVIRKYTKAGDTLSASSMNSTLCLIYDLSAMTFDMYVDELDISSVEVGQEVILTADAFENEEYTGIITTVSLVSTTSGGVTQYPVTVRLDDYGDLLPGMNVSGEIVIESVEDVLSVPTDALVRGNIVYVEDSSVTEATGSVPAGFREVEVTTGISDGDYIQIISGLEEGDRVYVSSRAASSSAGADIMGGMPGMSPDRGTMSNNGGMPEGNRQNGGGMQGGMR